VRRPSSMGSADSHGWGPLPIALCQTVAPSFSRLHEPDPQRGMGAHKMIVRAPPLQMGQEVWGLLSSGPGPSRERCHAVTDRQIQPFNECGVESSREGSVPRRITCVTRTSLRRQ
jgi:hypothetical protein